MTTVHAAMRSALLVATGGPGDWQTTTRLDGHDVECVAAHPGRPDRVLVGTFDAGLHRSADGGDTFERVGTDTLAEAVMSLAVSPHDPDVVWAGTEPSRVYRSTDGGASWVEKPGLSDLPSADGWSFPPRPHTHHVRWIAPDPDREGRLYVGIEAGALVRTDDAGETWQDRPAGARVDNHTLATHPDAPGRVYAAAGDGYAESTDGGDTWEYPQAGLEHRYVWGLAVDPGDPDTVVVSAATGAHAAHRAADAYVYRRSGGGSWERVGAEGAAGAATEDPAGGEASGGDGLPVGDGALRAVLATAGEAGEFWAVNNHGIYRSGDAGRSWSRLALDGGWHGAFRDRTARGLAVVG